MNSTSDDCPADLKNGLVMREKLHRGYTFDLPKYDQRYNECIYVARTNSDNINQIESESHYLWRKNEQSSIKKPSIAFQIFLTFMTIVLFTASAFMLYSSEYRVLGIVILLVCLFVTYLTVTKWISYFDDLKKYKSYDKWILSEPAVFESYIKSSS